MNFLTPAFLFGALALALPVVFHLIRRSTRDRLPFSSLLFLSPTPPRLTKRSRLEDLLLLLLRCLALGLLAFGFARPFLRDSPAADAATGQPRRLVLLVDRSASMQRDGLWPAALARATEVLGETTPADQVAVLAFDQTVTRLVTFEDWQAVPPGDRAAMARGKLGALKPGWAATQLGNALITAAETLTEADVRQVTPVKQVILISDLQEGGRLEKLQAYDWPKNLRLRALPVKARSGGNAGVQVVADAGEAAQTNATVRVRVLNSAESDRESFQVGWSDGNGGYVGTPADVYVPPGQARVVALPVPPASAGGVPSRQIRLQGDGPKFDNVAHVVPPEPTTVRVFYFGADADGDSRQPLFFLQHALPDSARQRFVVTAGKGDAPVAPGDLGEAGLIVVTGPVSGPLATGLRDAVRAGKTLLLAPTGAGVGATVAALLGVPGVPFEEAAVKDYAMLVDLDFSHPLFAPFADPRFSDFTKIHVWKHRVADLSAVNGARVLAKFDSGAPAVTEVPSGRGRVVLLGMGWHPGDSQLALSTKFVPLVLSLLDYAGATAGGDLGLHWVGEPVSLRSVAGAVPVQLPDGTTVSLEPGATNFSGTVMPGIYRVGTGAAERLFAVNLDPGESRTSPLGTDVFETYGIAPADQPAESVAGENRRVRMQAAEAESRQKLWRWFLLGTLLVLLVETALAGWTARRGQPTEATA